MKLLTSQEREDLFELINLQHSALMVEICGPQSISKQALQKLHKANLLTTHEDMISKAYCLGRAGFTDPRILDLTSQAATSMLNKHGLHWTDEDTAQVAQMRKSLGQYVEALGHTLKDKLQSLFKRVDKSLSEPSTQPPQARVARARAALGHQLQDLTKAQLREAKCLAFSEMQNAYNEGRARELIEKSGEDDPLVFKRPRPDCCGQCTEFYLEQDGVTPRLFRLSELRSNGTNIGKSRSERQPTLSATHPFCACTLQRLPTNFTFNKRGEMVYGGKKHKAS